MCENSFWRVCAALDSPIRIDFLRYLLSVETSEFPCVNEIAEKFDLCVSVASSNLKQLADVGLVCSKRSEKRVYYRAFATTPEGESVLAALKLQFDNNPSEDRLYELGRYIHALSHYRRNAIVRCLNGTPHIGLKEIAKITDIPDSTVARLLGDLDKAQIVDLSRRVYSPNREPESTLLALTLA